MLAQAPQFNYVHPTSIFSMGVGTEASALNKSLSALYSNGLSSFLATDSQKFDMLASTWKKDTMVMSSSTDMFSNESYLQIIGMGKKALPFIFSELRKEPNHWFVALKSITGIDPVPKEYRGNILKMSELWLAWAKDNHYYS